MAGSGLVMLAVAGWGGWLWWRRRRVPDDRWLLRAVVITGPLGLIAIGVHLRGRRALSVL